MKKIEFPRLAAEVRKYGVERQLVLASPAVQQLREWKALVPESATLLWMHGNEAKLAKDLAELRAHGVLFQVFAFTEDPTVIAQLLDLGVMSFATDHPDVVMRELKAYYAAAPASAKEHRAPRVPPPFRTG